MYGMLLISNLDPIVVFVCILALSIIIIGLILKRLNQPYIIGYIIIGAILGQHGFGLVNDPETIHHLGEIGIILLLFYIGMEISLPELVKHWKLAALGTMLQVGISVAVISLIGYYLGWSIERSIIIGFVIALSSSAIIIKIMEDRQIIDSTIGKNVLSILLMQDIIVVPLLIISSFIGGHQISVQEIVMMLIGGTAMVVILIYLFFKRSITLPFSDRIRDDQELQVFMAILLCFGGAILSSLFGLSAALGAFVGGMIIHAAKGIEWIHQTLQSFRVLFVSLFFVSIGLQINFNFIWQNISALSLVLLVVYITNHLINSFILRLFGCSMREAILGGAFLAQIGELSFLLISSAFNNEIIGSYGYNFTITMISLTLLLSPFWISLSERVLKQMNHRTDNKGKSYRLL